MSVTVAEGVVEVTADGSKIPRKLRDDIEGDQGPLEDAGRRSAGSFGGIFKGSLLGNFMGNIASDIVGQIGYAIGSGIRQAVEFGMGGIEIASGVAEAKTAIASVFGAGAGSVETFAAGAADAIGQSNLEALKAAQNFGVFGKAAGLAGEDNAAFSNTLVKTASDFASFYDTSPEDAIVAIGAALRGEYEPIRNYGLLLDEATLQQQALAMGIYDGVGPLTQQQKVLAANALIVSDANASYNDFAETSGGLANQQRTLAAEVENAQGKLGEALLPAMLQLTTFANDTLVPILNDVIETVGPMLGDALAAATPAFLDMVNAIVPAIPEFMRLASEALPGILDALGFLIPMVLEIAGSFILGAQQIGDFVTGVTTGFNAIVIQVGIGWARWQTFFNDLGAGFMSALGAVGAFFGQIGASISFGIGEFGRFVGEVGTNIGRAITFIAELPGRALTALGDLGASLFSSGQSLIQGFIDGIWSAMDWVGDAVGGVLDFAASFFPNSPAERGPFSGSGWTALGRSGLAIGEQFASGLDKARFEIPFSTTAGDDFGRAGSTGSIAAPGGGRGDTYFTVEVNEAEDPLGSADRVGTELRKWSARR